MLGSGPYTGNHSDTIEITHELRTLTPGAITRRSDIVGGLARHYKKEGTGTIEFPRALTDSNNLTPRQIGRTRHTDSQG